MNNEPLFPGGQHPAQAPIYGVVVALHLLVGGSTMVGFWMRRYLHPIKGRFPTITILGSLCITMWVVINSFGRHITPNNTPCYVPVIGLIFLQLGLECYVIRAFALFVSFRITSAKLDSGGLDQAYVDRWYNRAHWVKKRFLTKIAVVMGIIIFVLGVVLSGVENAQVPCQHSASELYALFSIFMFGCFFVLIAFKLRKCGADGFGIKRELKMVGLAGVIGVSAWFLTIAIPSSQKFDKQVFFYSDLVAIAAASVTYIGSIILPLRDSINVQKEQLTRLSMNEPSISRSNTRSDKLRLFLVQKAGRDSFEAFLAREFSVENLAFWEAVEEYRVKGAVSDDKDLLGRAKRIAEKFVLSGAPMEVNIRYDSRAPILKKLGIETDEINYNVPDDDIPARLLFDSAQDEIYELMSTDSFRRYRRTSIFERYQERYAVHHT